MLVYQRVHKLLIFIDTHELHGISWRAKINPVAPRLQMSRRRPYGAPLLDFGHLVSRDGDGMASGVINHGWRILQFRDVI